MSEVTGNGGRIRFGEFELDRAAGELRKNDRRIPIQEQPFQVLAALLERPGEVVTREYLRERLWPGQPFVDFDQGLNTAINKLRDALGDSAASPRFVETVPRRGYRFAFPVDLAEEQREPDVIDQAPRRRRPWIVAAGCLMAAIAGIGGLWWLRQPAPAQLPLRKFTLRMPVTTVGSVIFSRSTMISPDGRHIGFINDDSTTRRLWIQHLNQEKPLPVEGSEGATDPFWSPDSKAVGFADPLRWALMRVSVEGGVPTRICAIPGFFSGATWSPDGTTIVFGAGGPGVLHEVPAAGGTPKVIVTRESFLSLLPAHTRLGAQALYLHTPHFLPSSTGQRVLIFGFGWSDGNLMLRDLATGRSEWLGPGRLPFYSPTGHLLFQSTDPSQDLWAQPFSLARLQKNGPPFPVVRNQTEPTVSADGTLVSVDPSSERLVWMDRRGQPAGETGPPLLGIFYPAISPDGQRVAAEARETENLDIWVFDMKSGARTRLSTDSATEILPVWSPDGQEVAYSSWRAGNTDIFIRRADAGVDENTLVATPGHERVSDWSRDGRYIVYSREDPKGSSDLWYLSRNGAGEWQPHAFLQSRYRKRAPKLSPDGRFMAFLSDESGRDELYVRPFPQGDRQWAVSRNGAGQPRWARNGRELFYLEPGMLMSVPVRTTPDFSAAAPVPLFAHAGFGNWWDANYDVSADGERFLLPQRVAGPGKERLIHVVQNWFEEFRNRR